MKDLANRKNSMEFADSNNRTLLANTFIIIHKGLHEL